MFLGLVIDNSTIKILMPSFLIFSFLLFAKNDLSQSDLNQVIKALLRNIPRCYRKTFRDGFKITRTIFSYCEKCLKKTWNRERKGREKNKDRKIPEVTYSSRNNEDAHLNIPPSLHFILPLHGFFCLPLSYISSFASDTHATRLLTRACSCVTAIRTCTELLARKQ